jgi:hypothetical protein
MVVESDKYEVKIKLQTLSSFFFQAFDQAMVGEIKQKWRWLERFDFMTAC